MHAKLLWIALLLTFQALIVVLFVPSGFMIEQLERERKMTASWLGERSAEHITQRSNEWFRAGLVESGVIDAITKHLVPTRDERERERAMDGIAQTIFPFIEDRLGVVWMSIYQAIQRIQLLLLWLPFLLPIWIPAAWQGFTNRRIKQVSYGYAAPNRYHAAYAVIAGSIALLPAYLMAPLALSPMVMPAWGFILAGALLVAVSNLQKQW